MKLLRIFALLGSLVPALLHAFDPNANGNIYATAVQADGKVILGGGFTAVQPPSEAAPVTRQHLARFNADGTLDASFDPVFDGDVVAVVVQSDGGIVVAGKFTTAQGAGGGAAVARSGLARLNADGTLDGGFDPRPTGGSASTAQVAALALDANGNILIGGSFTTLQPGGTGATVARGRLARLSGSGAIDADFAPSFNSLVFALAVQPDGRILVGGGFTTVQYGSAVATTATRLARLNADGSLDTGFAVLANNRVLTLALESDGAILAGGDFTAVRGSADSSDQTRSFLARFKSDGTLDSFEPRPDASVSAVLVQRDGKILVGGDFASFLPANSGTSTSRTYLARLATDGSVDASFAPTPNAAVRSLALQSDGRILAGGLFTRFFPAGVTDGVLRNHAARLLASGDLDGTLASAEDGSISAAAVEASGSVIVGGTFNTLGGLTRQNLARILADGTIDPAFNPVLDGSVSAVVIQSDGKIVIGGAFTKIGSTKRTYLARLNVDGSLDTSYAPGPNGAVFALYLKSDGSVLAGGNFSAWYTENDSDTTTDNTTDNVSRAYLAEIDAAGKVTSLNWSLNSSVYAIARQTDGKFLLGGAFSAIRGTTRTAFARVSADGTVDSGVNPAPDGSVRAIAVQSDGKILFGGTFTTLQLDDGQGDDDDKDGLTNDDADRRNLARLNADGSLDKTYNPGADSTVTAIATLADGRVVIGGSFTHVGPSDALARKYLAAIGTTGTPDSSFTTQTNDRVYSSAKAADGTLYFVGRFTTASSGTSDTLAASNHILRLASDGTFQASWTVTASNPTGARVAAIAPQSDGRVLVGGSFSNLGGQTTTNLARFSAAGVRDTSFTTSADGTVNALLVQSVTASSATKTNTLAWFESSGSVRASFGRGDLSNVTGRINAVLVLGDGSLLVGGAFTITGSSIKHLAHFRADGTLDSAFNLSLDASVAALALQSDGKIAVGGAFTSMGGYTRNYLARLNSDLSVDTTFAPPALNSSVAALVVQSDNAIVVGGSFTSVDVDDGQNDDDDGDGATNDDTGRAYLARFKSDGTLDTSYDPHANAVVAALLLMPDGKILAGGSFTTFTPNGSSSATAAAYIALLKTDGTPDTSLAPTPNGPVMALARQADGKIIFGGNFTTLQLDDGEGDDDDGDGTKNDDADRHNLARLNADFTLDKTFKPEPDAYVQAIAVHADGRIFIGGAFSKLGYVPTNADAGVGRSFVAALTSSGAIDTTFNPVADNYVYTIALPADGSLIIAGAFGDLRSEALLYLGGEFSSVGGLELPRLARLTIDGSADSGFNPAPNDTVYALGAQADGSVLVAGKFTSIAGATRNRLARFTASGTLDGSFAPSVDGAVRALAVTPSGAIVIGGEFANVAGSARSRLARLTASGALDASFSPSVNGPVRAVAALPDGRILIGGEFTSVAGQSRNNLARLNADGSLDASFNPAPDGGVYALSARVDGTVLVGGAFTNLAGQSHAKLALLKADGSLDTTFTATANASVHALTGLLDGRAFVGGEFTTLGGAADFLLSRVSGATSGAYSFAVGSDLRSASWTLSGSAADFVAVTLSYSTNSNLWTTLGSATPSSDGKTWAWSGSTALPSGTNYLLRARAITAGSGGGAAGVTEAYWQFFNTTAAGTVTVGVYSGGNSGSSGGSGSNGGNSGSGSGTVSLTGTRYASTTNAGATGYFADFSALLRLKGSEVQFVNFVITGANSRRVFLRAAGPSLARMNISDFAAQPKFEVYTGTGAFWAAGATPVTDATTLALGNSLGALTLASGDADSALVTTLAPGSYVIAVWDAAGTGGAVMTELFEADGNVPSRFVAYSSRGGASTNTGTQTVEFTIKGSSNQGVLVRALGPALAAQSLSGGNADPTLQIQNSSGATVATNDNWETPTTTNGTSGVTAAQLSTIATNVGAAALASGSKDAALYVSLAPGSYTASVSGVNSAAGFTELEIYEVPATTGTSGDGTGGTTTNNSNSSSNSSGGGGGAPAPWAAGLLALALLGRAWSARRAR
ncbi:MAG: delta-60 repeat domain-containing protein [Candidatus Didemnitutus sp.]|nr:delta-60 repeat domain-containing protein [Candidatus Didemnitutus sp.]